MMKNKLQSQWNRLSELFKQIKGQLKDLVKSQNHRRALLVLTVSALAAGWLFSSLLQGPRVSPGTNQPHVHSGSKKSTIWTCAMHPQIRLPHPGHCPICRMKLIPTHSEAGEGMPSARRLIMSPDAEKLAEIQTSPVERKFVTDKIRMVGKVEYDETRIAYITAWTGGRIDRLYIDQTGVSVKKGDHMAYLYSPELLSTQEEYLQALEGVQNVKESHLDIIKSTSADTVKNAREKLKLLGVTDEQIKELEKRKEPNDHMTIYATANGIVLKREVEEGDYVKTGSRIYSIVDLSNVWVKLDAYESDLEWLRYGQEVAFEAEAYPGDIFRGRISLIDPVLDEVTRTVKIRVNVNNEDSRLKPGMFVHAVVHAKIAGEGKVMDTYLKDKWISPMHPEIIRDQPGICPICGMPLVSAESIGYTTAENIEPPLVIPASAVLKTGKRAVVYLKNPNAARPTFEGREIVLGTRAGDYYIVKSGLSEGDLVVTQGNFKIDSALQIQAKPSMMNPEGGAGGGGHDMSKMDMGNAGKKKSMKTDMSSVMAPQKFLDQLMPVYQSYFELQLSLASDHLEDSKAALRAIKEKLKSVDMNLLKDQLHADWMDLDQRIKNSIVLGLESKTLDDMRAESFKELSTEFLSLEKKFGHTGTVSHFKMFCPMALDGEGAFWLQSQKEIANPFLGKNMPTCGDVKTEYAPMNMNPPDKQVFEGSHGAAGGKSERSAAINGIAAEGSHGR